MAALKEKVDYSEEGGKYNTMFNRWEWTNDRGKHDRGGDKPALIYDSGTEVWCRNGLLHRLTGKAWIVDDDSEDHPWFINGMPYDTEEKFLVARDAYCKKHGILMSGHLTKRATPT